MSEPLDPRKDPAWMDPSILRGMTQRRLSRRDLLKYAGTGAGAMSLAAFLAACGVSSPGATKKGQKLPNAGIGTAHWWSTQKQAGQLNFANWPFYIDVTHGKHPSLEQFTNDSGIQVNYREVIQDNNSFFATIRPSLQAKQDTGWDIVVLTNNSPVLSNMFQFGWLIPLDHTRMPNFDANASSLVKNPTWDPGNKYTMAWQSGFTAIGYNTDAIKRPITSVLDLFDPAFKGKIGMMSDPQELGSVGLLANGVEPAKSTPADWNKAAQKLQAQKSGGLVRNYYDQSYINALQNGDTWITMAWSGDIFQSQLNGHKNLKLVVPKEGGMFWTDNMCIPLYAQHPVDAMVYMDYVYQPKIQAEIEDYNNYICPVPAAKEVILSQLHDPTVANSPLVFPTPDMQALARPYYQYKSSQDLSTWNDLFEPIIQS
jgi:spermidine/putrescine transport system substrate-binding protein